MRGALVTVAFLCSTFIAYAQDKPIATVQLTGTVTFAGIDRPGDLFIVMSDGWVRKYDKNGVEIVSKKFTSAPTLFDPRDGTLSFAYFREGQRLEYLSPDMSVSVEKVLNPEFAISAWQVCPSKNELWILDSADLSLRQTLDRGTAVAYDANWTGPKPSSLEGIVFMREYLNFLFVLDRQTGIYMFNNLGKPIRHIKEENLFWFNFLGEELYYSKGQALHFIDLYTGETREIALPWQSQFALLTDERLILVGAGKIEFRAFAP
jgi:hypothetical protein